jgi:hypothetical protein
MLDMHMFAKITVCFFAETAYNCDNVIFAVR